MTDSRLSFSSNNVEGVRSNTDEVKIKIKNSDYNMETLYT